MRTMKLLDPPKAMRAAGLNRQRVEEKLGWLRGFAPHLRRWEELVALAGGAEHYVRHEGIHARASTDLAERLPKPATPRAKRLRIGYASMLTSALTVDVQPRMERVTFDLQP